MGFFTYIKPEGSSSAPEGGETTPQGLGTLQFDLPPVETCFENVSAIPGMRAYSLIRTTGEDYLGVFISENMLSGDAGSKALYVEERIDGEAVPDVNITMNRNGEIAAIYHGDQEYTEYDVQAVNIIERTIRYLNIVASS